MFINLDDIEKHIRWEKHRKAIKTFRCLTNFKNDGIFKVENYFYCQFCNHIAHNIASIKEHTVTEKHAIYRTASETTSNRILAERSNGIVVIKSLKIDNHQWNGIKNHYCLLCTEKVGNEAKHMKSPDHIIRLIQAEVKMEGEGEYYRKVNTSTFQCFKCMTTFPTEDFENHWQQHKNLSISVDINGNSENLIKIYDFAEYQKPFDCEYDVALLADVKDEYFDIDIKNKEITCKKCGLAVRNTKNDLIKHMNKKHKIYFLEKSSIIEKITKDVEKQYVYIHERDAGKQRHELAVFGKKNSIKLNAGGSKGYCMFCDRFMSAHMNIFKEHVEGALHTGHMEMKGLIKAKKHKRGFFQLQIFSHHIRTIKYIPDMDAITVNNEFCIDSDSFLLVKRIIHGKHMKLLKCFVCDKVFDSTKEKSHCSSEDHRNRVFAAKVVIEEYNCLIREINPKLYHCSLCNVTCPYWETLHKHVNDNLSHKGKLMEKKFQSAMNNYQGKYGRLPESMDIQLGTSREALYENVLNMVYRSKLNNIRIFTVDLDEQNPNEPLPS